MVRGTNQAGPREESLIIDIGFDVLHILARSFEKEMGRAFYRVWNESLEGMQGLSRSLFEGLQAGGDHREINTHIVRVRWEERREPGDFEPLLQAFLSLLDAQLAAARRVLGPSLVQQASGEAVRMLSMVDRYRGKDAVARRFLERLEASPDAS